MTREGVRILLALESRRKPPPTDEEARELLEFFSKEEEGEMKADIIVEMGSLTAEERKAAIEEFLASDAEQLIFISKEEEDATSTRASAESRRKTGRTQAGSLRRTAPGARPNGNEPSTD